MNHREHNVREKATNGDYKKRYFVNIIYRKGNKVSQSIEIVETDIDLQNHQNYKIIENYLVVINSFDAVIIHSVELE